MPDSREESTPPAGEPKRHADAMVPQVYDELREIAERMLRSERSGHTLQATALVNEAYLKLAQETRSRWENENHFRAVACTALRRILVDYARTRGRLKRGGEGKRLSLATEHLPQRPVADLLEFNDALSALEEHDARAARLVELRVFGEVPVEIAASLLGISRATAMRDWQHARAWLAIELDRPGAG